MDKTKRNKRRVGEGLIIHFLSTKSELQIISLDIVTIIVHFDKQYYKEIPVLCCQLKLRTLTGVLIPTISTMFSDTH